MKLIFKNLSGSTKLPINGKINPTNTPSRTDTKNANKKLKINKYFKLSLILSRIFFNFFKLNIITKI